MDDPVPNSWDSIPLTKWQRLLAAVVEEGDFDLETAAEDAGLDEAQTDALKAWAAAIEREVEARHLRKELAPSTIKFYESLLPDLDPEQRAAAEREIEGFKKRAVEAKSRR